MTISEGSVVMATTIAAHRVFVSDKDAAQAHHVLETLAGPEGSLGVKRGEEAHRPVPREVGLLLQAVLQAVASGQDVAVSTVPRELTTSTAARLIGVSRPTLMRMIERQEIGAHKVGSHTRLASADVFDFIRARQDRRRAEFEALRSLLDD